MTSFTDVLLTDAKAERHVLASRLEALDALIAHAEDYQTKYAPPMAAPTDDDVDGPIEKVCEACGKPFPQRSNRQRICSVCRRTSPHRSAEEIATVVASDDLMPRLLEALAARPMMPGQLAKRVKATLSGVKRALRLGATAGTVRRKGYRWEIVPAPAASRSLADVVRPERPRATSTGHGPSCKTCDCRFKEHDPETGRCYGLKGKCVCKEFRS